MQLSASQFSTRHKPLSSGNLMGERQAERDGDLARVFNTALVSSHACETPDFFAELFRLVETPAFRSILGAVRELSAKEGLTEREACDKIIQTFRKMDRIWGSYLSQEGKSQVLKS